LIEGCLLVKLKDSLISVILSKTVCAGSNKKIEAKIEAKIAAKLNCHRMRDERE
jgi:hypothetical protein